MVRWVRALAVPLVIAGMVALAGIALGRIYNGVLLPELVAGAALGGVLVPMLTRRLPGWTAGPLSAAALFGYVLLAVRLSARAADVPGGLATLTADAARNGIPRLLTALIPVEPQPDTVLVPVVTAWLAALAGAELAVRGRRVLLGYLPPTLCYGAALYLVGPNAGTALWPTLAFAGLAALGLTVTGRPAVGVDAALDRSGRTVLSTRVAAGAAVALVVLAGLAIAVGPTVADRVRAVPDDPRRLVVPPQLDAFDENPLIRLSGWAVNPDQHLLDVTSDHDARLRLAVLSDYDGVTWRVGASYRSAGRTLPVSGETPSTVDGRGERVTQRVTIADLTGHLLPAVGVPHSVRGVRVAFDRGSGTLARPEGLDAGLAYTVTSNRSTPEVNALPSADVPSGPAVARMLALGARPPDEIDRLAKQLAEGNAGPYQRAAAIEQFLAEHYRLAADAPSGHAYPNLGFFLFGARDAGGQRGTSEQFAAAFAVLARDLGLPTRIVVGFQVRAGTTRVTGADALAWPEVLFTGFGWVPFHPLPEADTPARPVEQDFRPKPQISNPPPSEVPTVAVSVAAKVPRQSEPPLPVAGHSALPIVGWSALGAVTLGTIAFVVGVPLLRRAQRRRRLDRGPPPEQVAGAWLEVGDALRLAGRPAGDHLAATELADHAARAAGLPRGTHRSRRVRLPVPPLDDLVDVVNAAAFGAQAPGADEAARARAQAVAYVGELRARRSWWHRLMWTLHPGPLFWRRLRRRRDRQCWRRPVSGAGSG